MEEPDTADGAKKRDKLRAMITGGSRIAGGAAGAAVGFFAGGPTGAALLGAAGTMVSDALAYAGEEAAQRLLGPRERVRVGGVLALSAARIKERIKNGDQVRTDGFFDDKGSGRSDAEEVAESVILKAQREPEEKKIPYMANLLANVVFRPDVSSQLAHQLSKIAEALTYRQLCIIGMLAAVNKATLRQGNYQGQGRFPSPLLEIIYEIQDLYQRELVVVEGVAALGLTHIVPSKLKIQGLGVLLYTLMELSNIPDEEKELITGALR